MLRTLIPALGAAVILTGAPLASLGAADSGTAPITAPNDLVWQVEFAAAKRLAADQGKDIFLDFNGSDWCGPCIQLKRTILDHPDFASATAGFIFFDVDFPRRHEQHPAIKSQNEALSQAWGIRSFPTLILADSMGRPYGTFERFRGSPAEYADKLIKSREIRASRDKHFAAAAAAKTPADKAAALHAAFQAMGEDAILGAYPEEVKAILAGTTDPAVRETYEVAAAQPRVAEIHKKVGALFEEEKFDEATAALASAATDTTLPAGSRQELLLARAGILHQQKKDAAEVIAALREAHAMKSEGQGADRIAAIIAQLGGELPATASGAAKP